MKKIVWIIVACLCFGLVTYGVIGYGDSQVSAEVSKETKGSFLRVEGSKKLIVSVNGKETVYPLSASVWVYRNLQKSTLAELKPGDTLDLILNSKDQAAYIKASDGSLGAGVAAASAESAAPAPAVQQPVADGSASPAPSGGGQPAAGDSAPAVTAPAPAPVEAAPSAAVPAPQPKPAATAPAVVLRSVEKLSFQWKSSELTLRVNLDQTAGQGKGGSELYAQTKERAVLHLTGASADSVIQMLIKGLPTEQTAFEQALKQRIVSEFHLKQAAQEWNADVKWRESAAAAPAPVEKAKPEDKKQQEKVQQMKAPMDNGRNNNVQSNNDDHELKGKDNNKDNGKYKAKDTEKGKGKERQGQDD